MKVFCLAFLALLNTNLSAVEAFASSSRALSSSAMKSSHSRNFPRSHHLGDVEHEPVPEPVGVSSSNEKDERRTESSPPEVVVYDNVEILLDDTAYEMAMTSVAALFVALGLFFSGGLLKPRPALADEPVWSAAPTTILSQQSDVLTLESHSWNGLQSHIHSNGVTGDH